MRIDRQSDRPYYGVMDTQATIQPLDSDQRNLIERAVWLLTQQTVDINKFNGWRDREVSKGERIALIHSEASELLEWTRQSQEAASDHIDATGEAEELADILIRCFDYAECYGIPLASAVLMKLDYNASRGYRHGGKKI